MAVGNLLSSLRLAGALCPLLIGLLVSGQAVAQAQAPAPAGGGAAAAANADCKKLPGGNAPVQRMARLEGGMSVRNLELTYFGKPLYALTDSDIAYLRTLWPECGTYEDALAEQIAAKLRTLISDAKGARQDSLDWISSVEKDIATLKPGEESIRKIHDLWQEMLNREYEMLPGDLQYLAKKLSDKREELYTSQQQRQRTLVNPFDPGAPDTRSIRE